MKTLLEEYDIAKLGVECFPIKIKQLEARDMTKEVVDEITEVRRKINFCEYRVDYIDNMNITVEQMALLPVGAQ